MNQSTRSFAVRACVAAVCSGFVLCAAGQSARDQIQAGLERAVKTPTEIIWLRDEILAELWRNNPRLDDSPARCAETGNVKQGCTIGNPPAWRYIFGASAHDSRFRPLTSGVYLISPHAKKAGLVRAPSGEILLAAGTSVTLIDAAYPGIEIELTAPPDQALPLGNLAASDAGKVFGLLARQPGMLSASAASVLESGRVALKSAGEVKVAAATQMHATPPKEIAKPVEFAMLAPPVRVAEKVQASAPRPPLEFEGTIDVSRFPSGETVKRVAEAEAPRVARTQALVFAGTVDLGAVAKPDEKLKLDPGPIVVAVASAAAVAETPVLPARTAAAPEPAAVAPSAPVQIASAAPDLPPKVEPARQVQAITPVPEAPRVEQEVQRVASVNPDIARLRAEVEAEIERDRVRLAILQQQSCSGAGRPMQGCTISAPRRFSFAG